MTSAVIQTVHTWLGADSLLKTLSFWQIVSGLQADLETMQLFNKQINKLCRSSFARKMFTEKTGLKMTIKQGEPIVFKVTGPDEESIAAMVLTLRLAMQDNDAVSLRRIARMIEKYGTKSKHVGLYLDCRETLNKFLDAPTSPAIEITEGEESITLKNRQILRGVIYGELAHLDEEKRKAMERLRSKSGLSEIIDNAFNGVAGQFMSALFYMQVQVSKIHQDLTGEELPIDWPSG